MSFLSVLANGLRQQPLQVAQPQGVNMQTQATQGIPLQAQGGQDEGAPAAVQSGYTPLQQGMRASQVQPQQSYDQQMPQFGPTYHNLNYLANPQAAAPNRVDVLYGAQPINQNIAPHMMQPHFPTFNHLEKI